MCSPGVADPPHGHLAHSGTPEDLDGLRTYLDRIHVRQRLHPIRRTADGSAADLGGRSALRLASTAHETARRESGTVSGMCWFWPVEPLGCRSPQMPPPGADLGLSATSLSSVSRPIVGTHSAGRHLANGPACGIRDENLTGMALSPIAGG